MRKYYPIVFFAMNLATGMLIVLTQNAMSCLFVAKNARLRIMDFVINIK